MAQKVIKRKSDRKAQYDNSKGIENKVKMIDAAQMRKDLPDFSSGDTVKVHVKIKEGEKERIQLFEGLVIARRNAQGGKSFIVRKLSHGVGVERIFMDIMRQCHPKELSVYARYTRRGGLDINPFRTYGKSNLFISKNRLVRQ